MFLKEFEIDRNLSVTEIVDRDYRTADVFRKYDISYCCGGKWPLETACQAKGLDVRKVIEELESAIQVKNISNQLDFSEWDVVFLVDYIINVHHSFLKKTLGQTRELLREFSKEHIKKFSYLPELERSFDLLIKKIMPSMQQEEDVIFPYIRQIAHAHRHKEPYAALFIRTLRKPVEDIMFKGHKTVTGILDTMRNLTNNYSIPEKACLSHKVVFRKLKELDNDLMQHLSLEDAVLFPQVIAIEKELLNN
ncbi:MAG: DUF542 domain-containing protein [Sphingobacteriales bacterium]|nr:DUF542 domain-containing protein [Sphingobacteriales bacterium]